MSEQRKQPGSGRWALVGMGVLFVGPLAAAWLLYMGGIWQPGAGANHGELLDPVVTLPRDPQPLQSGGFTEGGYLLGKWSLVHYADGECDTQCADALVLTRQVRLALGRYIDRIQRVAFVDNEASVDTAPHPQLVTVELSGTAGDGIAAALRGAGGSERIYVVDPLGNLILSYPLSGPPADIRDDLKKLLRLSRIG